MSVRTKNENIFVVSPKTRYADDDPYIAREIICGTCGEKDFKAFLKTFKCQSCSGGLVLQCMKCLTFTQCLTCVEKEFNEFLTNLKSSDN